MDANVFIACLNNFMTAHRHLKSGCVDICNRMFVSFCSTEHDSRKGQDISYFLHLAAETLMQCGMFILF